MTPIAPHPSTDAPRLPALDGVRGLAILLVMTHNLNLLAAPQGPVAHALVSLLDRGWLGVQVFFVLSGFLITGILLDTRDTPHRWPRFIVSRALRILPLYYLTLLVVFVLLPRLGLADHTRPGTIASLALFTYNWVQVFPNHTSPLPHFWSLAVEEQFYLVWPFLIWHLRPRGILRLCAATVVLALAARLVLHHAGLPELALYNFSVCRMDALAAGAAVAVLVRDTEARDWLMRRAGSAFAAGALLIAAGAVVSHGYTQFRPATQTVGYAVLSIGLAAMLAGLACADLSPRPAGWAAPLRQAWLRRLGLYSYGIYVLHVPLHNLLGQPLMAAWGLDARASLPLALAYLGAGMVASTAAGALSYHAFEKHMLRLRPQVLARLPAHPAAARAPAPAVSRGGG